MSRKQRSGGYWVSSAFVFVMHQVIGTEGVIWLTILGTFPLRGSITMMHEAWAHSAFMQATHLILSNTPFFPVQIAAGAYLGWRLYYRWRHRSMSWVWILPGVSLTCAVIVFLRLNNLSFAAAGAILSHFFGWGCRADDHCYDQLSFMQLFYTSLAYSIGALWASRTLAVPSYLKNQAEPRSLFLGNIQRNSFTQIIDG
jgi:hypothetical protein